MKKYLFLLGLAGLLVAGWFHLSKLDQGILPETKRSLEQQGAIVQRTGLVLATDCATSTVAQCDNFANTDVLYLGGLVPCNENGLIALCNQANDRPVPLIKKALSWQLGINEAVVMYGPLPPTDTYFGIELLLYERHQDNLANPGGFIPAAKGETLPEPTMDGRFVVDASVGDTFNHRVLNTAPLKEENSDNYFALVISGNRIVMEQTVSSLIDQGFPAASINRVELPDSYFFGLDEKADTFRLVGRIGRPFDENAMKAFLRDSLFQYKLWRVTLNADTTGIEKFPTPDCSLSQGRKEMLAPPCHRTRKTPGAELNAAQEEEYQQFKASVKQQFGQPTRILEPVYREYSDEFCAETGTYCWGNNNDAVYININDPRSGALAVFDLTNPASKIVVAGIDHQLTNWADLWNLGFFDPNGATLGSVNFADIQQRNSKFTTPDTTLKSFYVQLKEHCGPADKNCYSVNFKKGAEKKFVLMNRIYLNPQTATGPDGEQTAMPVIYVYE